ncbi:hypothetical protein Q7P35_011646 [Cladosporium inversicolor]
MGRLQYLERLALGRSAYQSEPPNNNEDHRSTQGPSTTDNNLIETTRPTTFQNQRYDAKGRPVNLETETQNARLRHASNEVLALVGVVERKEHTDAKLHRKINIERNKRQRLQIREDNRGNEISAFIDVVSWFALWWPTALVRRIQIGLYSTDLPFAEILRYEAKMMFGNGWQGILLGLLPGTAVAILHKVIWQVLALIVEEGIGAIQQRIIVSGMRRRKARVLIRSLTFFVDFVLIAIDMLLLPLETYAFARQLNIAPPMPWRPLLTTQLPSFFRIAYSTINSGRAAFITSPAPLIMAYGLLTREATPEAPAFTDLTSHRLPSISEHPEANLQTAPSALRDPFGAIMHQTWILRQRFLQLVGWHVHEENRPGSTNGWETDVSYQTSAKTDDFVQMKVLSHRSTSLARLPATWLGLRIDMFVVRVMLLPLESMVMRKVLRFYLSSGMPVTATALGAGVGGAMPGAWAVLAGRAGDQGWSAVLGRISHVGLSMALNLGVEAVLFGAAYALIRRQGMRSFGWGQCSGKDQD